MVDLIVKTVKGLERVAAARIKEALGNEVLVKARPLGFLGIVTVEGVRDKEEAKRIVESKVPEVERALVILGECKADLNEIAEVAKRLIRDRLSEAETFAVRTVRRGSHTFTSIDVNVRVGATVKEVTGADVNLSEPDKTIQVEIIGDKAYISLIEGTLELKKVRPGKPKIAPFLRRITVVQVPYLGDREASYKMGVRIGRGLQTFEIGGLYIAPFEPVPVEELEAFLQGVIEGRESRYRIQRRAYAREPFKVPIYLYDLYQYVRNKGSKEVIIATSTSGDPVWEALSKLEKALKGADKISILVGSRKGLPRGVFRFSDAVIDVAPSITLPTDYAAVAIIMAIVTVLEGRDFFDKY
ncbi:MAG: RNA-binding protein [Thermofilum sp. ex4484_15]|nr:MAG: RNA-binding protein [Thermofilum sp. ex4484_15]